MTRPRVRLHAAPTVRPTLALSCVTAVRPQLLAKSFALDDSGGLVKTAAAQLVEGRIERVEVPDLRAFVDLCEGLTSAQALAYGLPHRHGRALQRSDIVIKDDPDGRIASGEAIARSNDFMRWEARPGVLLLDHDEPFPGTEPPTAEALRDLLLGAVPELADAPMAWRTSGSSYIYTADGRELNGLRGQRLYIAVADATRIEAAGRAINDRLWAAGLGWVKIGAAGQLLERSIFDASVWQRSRLDFAGPPALARGLTRRAPAAIQWNESAPWFDLARLTADEGKTVDVRARATKARKAAREGARLEAAQVRAAWTEQQAPALAARRGIDLEEARGILRAAVERRVLFGDFELVAQDGRTVTVAEVLDYPKRWHMARFADPLEPEYGNDKRIAVARILGGSAPTIYSHAHGGVVYRLERAQQRIELGVGQQPRILDSVLEVLRLRGELFDLVGDATAKLVRVVGGRAVPVEPEWLTDHLGRTFAFHVVKRTGDMTIEEPREVPAWLAQRILAKSGERGFRRLAGVVTAPTMRVDGSVLDTPGYDEASGLLYLCAEANPPRVPDRPTKEQATAALARLWEPVSGFPFVDDVDRGVALAGMLTAAVRASLPTAPGFAFDAPTPGSGKTKLARLLGILATGEDPAVLAPPTGKEPDEELRKVLHAALLEGRRVLVLDNLRAPLGGAALDAFLTAPFVSGRTLQKSETPTLPNRALFIATGNNLRLVGDTCRRVLVARVDPRVERPWERRFDFDPLDMVSSDRLGFVTAALTLLRAAVVHTEDEPGRIGSFEVWDARVRRAVLWVAEHARGGATPTFGDPQEAIARGFANDPETSKLSALLDAWAAEFNDRPTTVAEAVAATLACDLHDDHPSPLRDAVEEIAQQGHTINRRVLGRYIERHVGRRLSGRWLEKGNLRHGSTTWVLRTDAPRVHAVA